MHISHTLRFPRASQFLFAMMLSLIAAPVHAQGLPPGPGHAPIREETTQELNQQLERSRKTLTDTATVSQDEESRIGPGDLLEITVFEAPEMNRTVRVSANGEISLQLLGPVKAAGLAPRELESLLQDQLRRTYMKDPHVGVFIRELQSHAVSVVGAVNKPGVFQVPSTRGVIELLSMAGGLADIAGDTILIMRGGDLSRTGAAESQNHAAEANTEIVKVNLKSLLDSADSSLNVSVHPGDIVKVARAGIVYVVGEVRKPGGFVLKNNENISVLQALALAEGVTPTSAKSQARIIRTDLNTDKRIEIPVDLGKILASKEPDPMLQPKDVVFVLDSSAKNAFYRGAEAALTTATGLAVYRW